MASAALSRTSAKHVRSEQTLQEPTKLFVADARVRPSSRRWVIATLPHDTCNEPLARERGVAERHAVGMHKDAVDPRHGGRDADLVYTGLNLSHCQRRRRAVGPLQVGHDRRPTLHGQIILSQCRANQ